MRGLRGSRKCLPHLEKYTTERSAVPKRCGGAAQARRLSRACHANVQFLQLLLGDGGRRFGHQVDGLGRLGERDDFAQVGRAGQQHHNAIEAERNAAVRRRAVFERVKEESETGAGFFVADARATRKICCCTSLR